jgi:hypothetical protein
MTKSPIKLPPPVFNDEKHHIRLYQGDSLELLPLLPLLPESSVDLIFADPPYFLSKGGITCHAGKMVSVNKGDWDKSRGPDANHEFNRAWLAACQRVLKPNGSIWVSGTAHVIHSVGFAMQQLGFKLRNDISWVKPNPPPNLSCRYFTHATEIIIWAPRQKIAPHLQLQAHEGAQPRQANEIRLGNQASRIVGKALWQAWRARLCSHCGEIGRISKIARESKGKNKPIKKTALFTPEKAPRILYWSSPESFHCQTCSPLSSPCICFSTPLHS